MKLILISVVFLLVIISEAVPTDYVFETWSGTHPHITQCRLEDRLGLPPKKSPVSKAEDDETPEDDELNRLFSNFWAVDHLPKESPYVSVKKLPDVYMDQNDQPSPISDLMPVERSEITEEARNIRIPEFGERPLYDQTMQMMDNVGNNQQYPDYMLYPQYPIDNDQNYEDVNLYSDNNTHPQEDMELTPVILKNIGSKKDVVDPTPVSSPKEEVCTSFEKKTTEKTEPTATATTKKITVTTKKIHNTKVSDVQEKESKLSTIQHLPSTTKDGDEVSKETTPCTDKFSLSTEKVTTSISISDNVMKVSSPKLKHDEKKNEKS